MCAGDRNYWGVSNATDIDSMLSITIKKELIACLEQVMMPIRDQQGKNNIGYKDIIRNSSNVAQKIASETLAEIKDAFGILAI